MTKSNFKDLFNKTFVINENEKGYIIELTYSEYSANFEEIIYNKYLVNYKLLKKYDPCVKKVSSFKELVTLINNKKNNIYILFDNNLNTNIKYYLVIWDQLHS